MKTELGETGIKVPRLCIGLDWKGYQDIELAKKILKKAYDKGYNFWDTADDYGTHSHVREALKIIPRKDAVICTKISSRTYEQAKNDVGNCLKELGIYFIDILLLHGLDSISEFKNCKGAWDYLKEAKEKGIIKAIGVSTHSADVVDFLADSDTDVTLTSINRIGRSVFGGLDEMKRAIEKAAKKGRGMLAMKILGNREPELLSDVKSSIIFAAELPFDSLIIGIRSLSDLNEDIKIVEEFYKNR